MNIRSLTKEQQSKRMIRCAAALIVISIVYIFLYTRAAAFNYPFETWFHHIPLLGKYYDGNLAFGDLLTTYCEHGMLGENFLFLMNGIFFNLSTDFEVIITSAVAVGILALLFFELIQRRQEFGTGFGILLMALLSFLVIPVDSHGTGMNTQVRLGLLCFVLTAVLIDRAFAEERIPVSRLAAIVFSIFVGTNIFGTLYSVAGIPCIALYMLVGAICSRKLRRERIIILLSCILFSVLYFFEYGFWSFSSSGSGSRISSGGALNNLGAWFAKPGDLIKAFLAWCVGGFINVSTMDEKMISETGVIIFGILSALLYGGAIFIYLKRKYYMYFYLPAFLMSYSLCLWIELLAGRPFSWDWYLSSWYSIHAKMLPLGALLIYAYALRDLKKARRGVKTTLQILSAVFCLIICMLNTLGTANLLRRAPYSKAWEKQGFKYLFVKDESEMPVTEDGMTPLLSTLPSTMEGIQIMREHNLNVYETTNSYREMNEIGSTKDDCRKISGVSSDSWLADKAEIQITTGTKGIVHIVLYNPLPEIAGEEGLITVEGVSHPVWIKEGGFGTDITTEPNRTVTVLFDFSTFARQHSERDQRILSVLLSDIYTE